MLHMLITLLIGVGDYHLNLNQEGQLAAAMFFIGREQDLWNIGPSPIITKITAIPRLGCAVLGQECGAEPVIDWLLPLFMAVVTSILVGSFYV